MYIIIIILAVTAICLSLLSLNIKEHLIDTNNTNLAVVLSVNQRYLSKFLQTHKELRKHYSGDIVLITAPDVKGIPNDVITFEAKKIKIPQEKRDFAVYPQKVDGCIQKFNLFDPFFKKWKWILYMDCGIRVYSSLDPIINMKKKQNTIYARDDAVAFGHKWKIKQQFNHPKDHKDEWDRLSSSQKKKAKDILKKLKKRFKMNSKYFQSTVMLFDTDLIQSDTVRQLENLLNLYPSSKMNDQTYVALHFLKKWKELPTEFYTYFYDSSKPAILSKSS